MRGRTVAAASITIPAADVAAHRGRVCEFGRRCCQSSIGVETKHQEQAGPFGDDGRRCEKMRVTGRLFRVRRERCRRRVGRRSGRESRTLADYLPMVPSVFVCRGRIRCDISSRAAFRFPSPGLCGKRNGLPLPSLPLEKKAKRTGRRYEGERGRRGRWQVAASIWPVRINGEERVKRKREDV